jgi:ABC-type transporter Mla subunit MlaD
VDELAQAVQGLSDMVMQIAQAIQQQQQAPPPDVSQGLAQLADHLGPSSRRTPRRLPTSSASRAVPHWFAAPMGGRAVRFQ